MPNGLTSITLQGITYSALQLAEKCQIWLEADSIEAPLAAFLLEWMNEDDFITTQTSGSTGPPKTIRMRKATMLTSARKTLFYFQLHPGDSVLLALPMPTIAAKMMVVRAMAGQLDLWVRPPTSTPLEGVPEKAFHFAPFTPFQIAQTLGHPQQAAQLARIEKVLLGGGPVESWLETRLAGMPNAFYHSYGMTETMSHVAIRPINGRHAATYYSALPGITFTLDERSCLVIHAPDLMRDPLVTNDLADLQTPERFTWLGRFDNAIISGGVKHVPEVLEKQLANLIPERFFITSAPHDQLGQAIILVIESQPYASEKDRILADGIDQLLDRIQRPKQVFFVPKFAYTHVGKVDRKKTVAYLHGHHS